MNFLKPIPAYGPVGQEYYDVKRHPTCGNFGELSSRFIRERIVQSGMKIGNALEVGAGKPILADVLCSIGFPLAGLTLLDESTEMLHHSKYWIKLGAAYKLADARNTGFGDRSFDLIVSSLGDPYNVAEFWAEMRRIISNNGILIFTTPSFEWSHAFRPTAKLDEAEFMLSDGRRVAVPSFTLPLKKQRSIIADAKFQIIEEATPTINELTGEISPKLQALEGRADNPVIYCFKLRPI